MSRTTLPTAASLNERQAGQTFKQHYDAVRQAQTDRLAAMQTLTDNAGVAGRSLLASEQREFDAHDDEVRRIGIILRRLDNSPENQVDRSQIVIASGDPGVRTTAPELPLLTRGQSFADWTARSSHGAPQPAQDVRLGALLRTWVTGRRDGLNDSELRAMAEGTATAGGHLVPTPTAGQLIDRARNVSRVFQAGATTVPMDSQTLKVPRLTGSSAPAWRNENAAIAEGDLTLDAVTLTARSMAFLVKMSRELIEDSDPSIVGVVERDLAAQVALELDRVALRGTGTAPQPRGVLNQTGVTVTTHGANGALIAADGFNYDALIDAQAAIRAFNHEPTGVITAPRTEQGLAKLKDAEGRYLQPPAGLLTRYPTNQVPIDLTVGTSTDCSEVYTGDWAQLYFGLRTGPMTIQLVERYADTGQVALLIWMRGDIALAHGEAFAVDTGVRG
ncbi:MULTISPECIES: phage major capsid protein [Streptomyces]|uniref:Phage major capsid protein n=1 Tax=Streptomyces parvus TaxID=66428 RepID=A0A5D4JM19_9ACTN|nr:MULTISPECIES: phage major capsid protein [Streptomyces]TYR66168.1 phage major capsid protein [Streptomyces parvus]